MYIGSEIWIIPKAASAASTVGFATVTVTRSSKTSGGVVTQPQITDKTCLRRKVLQFASGAAAGALNFIAAHNFPADKIVPKSRRYYINPDDPIIYQQIQSQNLGAVGEAHCTHFFAVREESDISTP
jgi:hypothetical protein